jgi:hypothetical protein
MDFARLPWFSSLLERLEQRAREKRAATEKAGAGRVDKRRTQGRSSPGCRARLAQREPTSRDRRAASHLP